MSNHILVKKSKINKKGVFAVKDFKKGEIALKWNPKIIVRSEIDKLPKTEKHYIQKINSNKYLLMQPPERYVNHSCDPNTYVKNNCDIALKNIRKGEEVTSDYAKIGAFVHFKCNCGSKNCQKIIAR